MLTSTRITQALDHESPGRRLAILARGTGWSAKAANIVEVAWVQYEDAPQTWQSKTDALTYLEGAYAAASGSTTDGAAVAAVIRERLDASMPLTR